MKKTIILLMGLFFAISFSNAQGVHFFSGTFDEAKQLASNDGKHILLYFCSPSCGPCKVMERDVFPNKEVGDYVNRNFIFVKCDSEVEGTAELKKKFNVSAYPTYIVLDTDENIIHRFLGSNTTEGYVAVLKAALDPAMSLKALQARFDAGERDKQFMQDYGAIFCGTATRQTSEAANTIFNKIDDSEKILPEFWFLYRFMDFGSPMEQYLVNNLSRFNQTIGKEKVNKHLADLYLSNYKMLFLIRDDNPSQEEFLATDSAVRKVGLENNKEIQLYRAAANIKLSNATDEFLNVFEKNKQVLKDERAFLYCLCFVYPDTFTAKQKERLLSLTDNEEAKQYVKEMSVK